MQAPCPGACGMRGLAPATIGPASRRAPRCGGLAASGQFLLPAWHLGESAAPRHLGSRQRPALDGCMRLPGGRHVGVRNNERVVAPSPDGLWLVYWRTHHGPCCPRLNPCVLLLPIISRSCCVRAKIRSLFRC